MSEPVTHTYKVPDMSCQHCVDSITNHVSAVADVEDLRVDLETKLVTVTGGSDPDIVAAIDDAGYDIDSR